MIYSRYDRDECARAAIRGFLSVPEHFPLVLVSSLRKANYFYAREELDDLISDGVVHQLWELVCNCSIRWGDTPQDWYADCGRRYRAIWLNVYFRPGSLEWMSNLEDVRRENMGKLNFPLGPRGRFHP